MKQVFYYHLLDFPEIEEKLNQHEIEETEKEELLLIIKETIHYQVISRVLTNLPEQDHQWFLKEYTKLPHKQGFLETLKEKIEDIEGKIKEVASQVKQEILAELESEE